MSAHDRMRFGDRMLACSRSRGACNCDLAQVILFVLMLSFLSSCGSVDRRSPTSFSKEAFVRQNAITKDDIQWVLFRPYWLHTKLVADFSSGLQGFRFEPPEGSILGSQWDKAGGDRGSLVKRISIRNYGFKYEVTGTLDMRRFEALLDSWEAENRGKSEEVILGFLVGGYLVNYSYFSRGWGLFKDGIFMIQLPFCSTAPDYSLDQLKRLFPDAVVWER